jgi:hypothetical protein
MVWDRQNKGPVKTENGLATGLSKERAEEVLGELIDMGPTPRDWWFAEDAAL